MEENVNGLECLLLIKENYHVNGWKNQKIQNKKDVVLTLKVVKELVQKLDHVKIMVKNVNGKDSLLKLQKIVNVIGKHILLKEEEKEENVIVVIWLIDVKEKLVKL